ncbi:MAG TPA: BON domain-containing protein [Kofleriaceae bacterium]|nr:BON domain-containing protein [Kofleriaceae bacterium]
MDLASFHRDDDRDRGYGGRRDDDRELDDRRPRSWSWRPDEREPRDDRGDWRAERRFDDRGDDREGDRRWRDRGARFSENDRVRDPYEGRDAYGDQLLRGAVRDHDETNRDLSHRSDRMDGERGPRYAPKDERWRDADDNGGTRQRIAQRRGPHHGKGPVGFHRSDDRIRELVCEALTDDGEVDATRIEVSVSGGEVTLSGTIHDRRMKRLAEDCVEAVPGVKDVHNQLRISEPTTAAERGGKHEPSDRKHRPS